MTTHRLWFFREQAVESGVVAKSRAKSKVRKGLKNAKTNRDKAPQETGCNPEGTGIRFTRGKVKFSIQQAVDVL